MVVWSDQSKYSGWVKKLSKRLMSSKLGSAVPASRPSADAAPVRHRLYVIAVLGPAQRPDLRGR